MKAHPWTFRKHMLASLIGGLVLTAILSLVLYLMGYAAVLRAQVSIPDNVAIIGSADGPTAIFVTGNLGVVGPQLVLFVLITLLLLALFVPIRKWVAKRQAVSSSP